MGPLIMNVAILERRNADLKCEYDVVDGLSGAVGEVLLSGPVLLLLLLISPGSLMLSGCIILYGCSEVTAAPSA